MNTYLGIDIGGTKIAGAVVSALGEVMVADRRPAEAWRGGAAILRTALDLAVALIAANPGVAAIGIGSGGQIDADSGVVLSATDLLPGWAGTNLVEAFGTLANLPVAVDNDVNALAAAECRFGAARGMSTVVFLALGTGVGGALVLDGRLHHGAHFAGAEFGHILLSIADDARFDGGGAKGTLEAYCSGPGIAETYRELGGQPNCTAIEIAAMAETDPNGIAARAIEATGTYLGYGLVSLANALDPDMIVIGGGLAGLGDMLLAPARRILRERALPGPAECPVALASLGEHASVIGAASLAMPRM